MPVKRRTDTNNQQLPMDLEAAPPEPASKPTRKSAKQPTAPSVQPQLFDSFSEEDLQLDPPLEPSVTDLVPVEGNPLGFLETETVNALVAMAGLSTHTQRAYQRWIKRYLADINRIDRRTIDLKELNIALVISTIGPPQGPANLKAWLGQLKAKKLGKQSIMQAKASIVWLAQLMADLGRTEYSVASGLSRVKAPRAESGQREGTWLTQDEVRQLLRGLRRMDAEGSPSVPRNTAIVVMIVTCGLRRDEIITATWNDLSHQGRNAVIRVHGKGEKLRIVKLPDMVAQLLETWKMHHPNPTGDYPLFTRIWKGGVVTTEAISDKAIWLIVQKAAKLAGLPPISPHDLRRSFARGAYEAGVSFELIRQALGHSNIATTERYVNSVLELDHAATDIWAGTLGDDEE
ncbi:MAG: tyrosine-type recombinase/integrase [Chloroflexota bacterium]